MLSLAQFNKNLDINEEKGGFVWFFFLYDVAPSSGSCRDYKNKKRGD